MFPQEKPPEPHDARVQLAQSIFRRCGFTLHAMQFKRPEGALRALKKFNGLALDFPVPLPWHYFPNEWCRDNWLKMTPCAHRYSRAGHAGMIIFYECDFCPDEYDQDVS